MVIIIKKGTPEAAIRQLLAQLSMQNVKGGCVAGEEAILLPLVGETWRLDPNALQALPYVREVRRLTPPYRLAGRAAHPADTAAIWGADSTAHGPAIKQNFSPIRASPTVTTVSAMLIV